MQKSACCRPTGPHFVLLEPWVIPCAMERWKVQESVESDPRALGHFLYGSIVLSLSLMPIIAYMHHSLQLAGAQRPQDGMRDRCRTPMIIHRVQNAWGKGHPQSDGYRLTKAKETTPHVCTSTNNAPDQPAQMGPGMGAHNNINTVLVTHQKACTCHQLLFGSAWSTPLQQMGNRKQPRMGNGTRTATGHSSPASVLLDIKQHTMFLHECYHNRQQGSTVFWVEFPLPHLRIRCHLRQGHVAHTAFQRQPCQHPACHSRTLTECVRCA